MKVSTVKTFGGFFREVQHVALTDHFRQPYADDSATINAHIACATAADRSIAPTVAMLLASHYQSPSAIDQPIAEFASTGYIGPDLRGRLRTLHTLLTSDADRRELDAIIGYVVRVMDSDGDLA
jgi:hypothetical protein